jgi:hypothetical protein
MSENIFDAVRNRPANSMTFMEAKRILGMLRQIREYEAELAALRQEAARLREQSRAMGIDTSDVPVA